ncbi:MAG: MBL fold metallo-hydrolase [Actinobacteria bacterium]|nr:MBL fold metallo-hydrolase [Actinomycetota bacterium]MCB9388299.1 MBL fold metallo-hydrolase [Acidimicrobiia bacterium]
MSQNPTHRFGQSAQANPADALFFWTGGPDLVAERTWFQSAFSGVTAFETDEGIVLVDSGMAPLAPTLAAMVRQVSAAPVHTAIYTHGHIDHAYGLGAFLLEGQAPPNVIAHRALLERLERYRLTEGYNRAINARQFQASADADLAGVDFAGSLIQPTMTYDDELSVSVGGMDFQLHHARGETDDHTWVFCPERSVLCTGDLIIWAAPNAGNPQKVQRYPWDWAAALRSMDTLGARTLCPGHGGPVIDDPQLVRQILSETAEFLETIVERTLALMNDGAPPHVDIVRNIDLPASASPWLSPVYDEAEFIVRNVIRYFGGWYSGRPSELKPAPRVRLATAIAELAASTDGPSGDVQTGACRSDADPVGPGKLIAAARRVADEGDLAVACHLADFALEAGPEIEEVRNGVAAIYEQRASYETSLMAINLYRSAAAYAREGRAFH